MSMMTWDPSRDLSLLQGDVNRLFDRFFVPSGQTRQRWVPPIDIIEQPDRFVVRADLPGLGQDDVEIEVDQRVLRIAGERGDHEHDRAQEGYYRSERPHGRFERTLTLPHGVDVDAIEASFDRGVLELRVPKPEQARPRRVPIRSGSAQTLKGGSPRDTEEHSDTPSAERELSHA